MAALWAAKREELGHPLGVVVPGQPSTHSDVPVVASSKEPSMFVLEIGCEEIPPQEVNSAIEQLESSVGDALNASRLHHNGVRVMGTPRRIVVVVDDLAGYQTTFEEKVRGPPAKIAFDANGEPSKALLGFCKKNGVSPQGITVETDAKGVDYVHAVVVDEGKSASHILVELLPDLLSSVSFRKSMRWNSELTWSRPVRWILALHGEIEVMVSLGNITSGGSSRLLRGATPEEISIKRAEDYLPAIQRGQIVLDFAERREQIWQAVLSAAKDQGGSVPDSYKTDLLDEVTNLVESPTVITGSFDEEFVQLPYEVLVTVMRKHQRYFPVISSDDSEMLLPVFITVANGNVDADLVRMGNEAVLRARFQDAEFFYTEDLEESLDAMRAKLSGTMFEKSLGNLLEKTVRIEKLVRPIGYETGLQGTEVVAKRAAHICRADLASSMVMEMTSLAGTVGRHYALFWGESPDVAQAVFESVLPRYSGDTLPMTSAGIVVSLADKVDSLVGLVAAGRAPSGAADPFAMRRTAYGLLQTLIVNKVHLDTIELIDIASGLQNIEVTPKARKEVLAFIQRRLEQLLVDRGLPIQAGRLKNFNLPYNAKKNLVVTYLYDYL